MCEKSTNGFGAYVPDLPGVGVVGRTMKVTKARILKAVGMHVAAMREDGEPIPEPTTQADYAEVA
ncbi:MAG: type II toxin-antitoxin system HicB family antitoxin [Bryobacteraceae bacterium]|nr:type II toxin-antitoxin system HicB family antitoxin [Bryobacteraceae bacterium]